MNKLLYSSPDVMYLEIMAGTILTESDDANTISSLELYELVGE